MSLDSQYYRDCKEDLTRNSATARISANNAKELSNQNDDSKIYSASSRIVNHDLSTAIAGEADKVDCLNNEVVGDHDDDLKDISEDVTDNHQSKENSASLVLKSPPALRFVLVYFQLISEIRIAKFRQFSNNLNI